VATSTVVITGGGYGKLATAAVRAPGWGACMRAWPRANLRGMVGGEDCT